MPVASRVRSVASATQVRIKVSDGARFVTVRREVPGCGMLSRLRRIGKGIWWAASFWMLKRPTADGRERYMAVSGMPVFDGSGQFVGYRGVGRHITERKRAEDEHR